LNTIAWQIESEETGYKEELRSIPKRSAI